MAGTKEKYNSNRNKSNNHRHHGGGGGSSSSSSRHRIVNEWEPKISKNKPKKRKKKIGKRTQSLSFVAGP